MKKFIVALCLLTLAVPIFIASATPVNVEYSVVQEVGVSEFNISPVRLVSK